MVKDDKENHNRNRIGGEMQNEDFADCIGRGKVQVLPLALENQKLSREWKKKILMNYR